MDVIKPETKALARQIVEVSNDFVTILEGIQVSLGLLAVELKLYGGKINESLIACEAGLLVLAVREELESTGKDLS